MPHAHVEGVGKVGTDLAARTVGAVGDAVRDKPRVVGEADVLVGQIAAVDAQPTARLALANVPER